MRLPDLELASPKTVAEACRYLEAGSEAAQALAGGTDLLMALKDGQKRPGLIVDLNGISGLDKLEFSPQSGLEIGTLVTLRRLAEHPAVQSHYPVLVQAASRMGTLQLQEMGTVGGNLCQDSCCLYFNRSEDVRKSLPPCHKLGGCICHVVKASEECWAPYSGDMAPVLMVLGATVTVADKNGEATRPLAALFSDDGVRPLDLEPGQLVTGIHCPAPSRHSAAAYFKLRPRDTLDFAVLGGAVSLTLNPDDTSCVDAAVVLTGVGQSPVTVTEARDLIGGSVTDAGIERVAKAATKIVHPVKNVSGAQPGYRRRMVKVLVEQALRDSLQTAMAASSGDIQ